MFGFFNVSYIISHGLYWNNKHALLLAADWMQSMHAQNSLKQAATNNS